MQLIDVPVRVDVAQIAQAVLQIGVQMVVYVLALVMVSHYVRPERSNGHRALGFLIGGVILGILAASFYANTFENIFGATAKEVSVAMVFSVLGNLALSHHIFLKAEE